jgi:peptidoglycan/xylan/chitin deacetylase (PgdA/CDA1 family)
MNDSTGSTGAPSGYVALTFDDGPGETTSELLGTLAAAGVRATLFNTGEHAVAEPGLVAAEVAAGMWIGNHSFTHPHMLEMSVEEMRTQLERTQRAIEAGGAGTPTLFRPPYGEWDARLEAAANGLGMRVILWDIDTQDWNKRTADEIVAAADGLQAGQVLLMHDWPPATLAAIPRIVAGLAARGLGAGMIDPETGRAVAPK